jgi:hypothetical protein
VFLFLQKTTANKLEVIECENSKLTNQVKQIQIQLNSQAIEISNLNNKLKEAEEKLIR